MTEQSEVPLETVANVRSVCLGLPEAYEEPAWVGTRWRIRKQTFAHVVMVDSGWPAAYARAAGSDGPITVLTFRSSGPELASLSRAGHPFFKPVWFPDIVGMTLDAGVDWDEVAELLTESYCVLAPKKLVELVDRPTDRLTSNQSRRSQKPTRGNRPRTSRRNIRDGAGHEHARTSMRPHRAFTLGELNVQR